MTGPSAQLLWAHTCGALHASLAEHVAVRWQPELGQLLPESAELRNMRVGDVDQNSRSEY